MDKPSPSYRLPTTAPSWSVGMEAGEPAVGSVIGFACAIAGTAANQAVAASLNPLRKTAFIIVSCFQELSLLPILFFLQVLTQPS